jgi:hypothetical protein
MLPEETLAMLRAAKRALPGLASPPPKVSTTKLTVTAVSGKRLLVSIEAWEVQAIPSGDVSQEMTPPVSRKRHHK